VSGFLLGTNCVSELVRVKPEPRVLEWMEAAEETLLHLSVLTLGDLRKGLADRWGLLAARARRIGAPLPIVDGLLAATALHHNLTMVSRNVCDFAAAQVPVLNPWEAL
jgi:predicted nucleic acid-binding protein